MQIISIEACQEKKKKKKTNIKEIDTETLKQKQTKRVTSS